MTAGDNTRPGGRTARNSNAIYSAVLELITTVGLNFTFQEVSELSGVSRRTLHRRWSDRTALLSDSLDANYTEFEVPLTGDFAVDVQTFAYRFRDFCATPREIAITGLAASAKDDSFALLVQKSWSRVNDVVSTMADRAVATGQVADGADADTALTMLISTITVWSAILRTWPDDATVDKWVQQALAGLR